MDVCTYGWMHECMHVWMNGYMHGCMHGYMDTCMHVCIYVCMDRWMEPQMDCMHGLMDTCTDGCMDERIHVCVCMYVCMYAWVDGTTAPLSAFGDQINQRRHRALNAGSTYNNEGSFKRQWRTQKAVPICVPTGRCAPAENPPQVQTIRASLQTRQQNAESA